MPSLVKLVVLHATAAARGLLLRDPWLLVDPLPR